MLTFSCKRLLLSASLGLCICFLHNIRVWSQVEARFNNRRLRDAAESYEKDVRRILALDFEANSIAKDSQFMSRLSKGEQKLYQLRYSNSWARARELEEVYTKVFWNNELSKEDIIQLVSSDSMIVSIQAAWRIKHEVVSKEFFGYDGKEGSVKDDIEAAWFLGVLDRVLPVKPPSLWYQKLTKMVPLGCLPVLENRPPVAKTIQFARIGKVSLKIDLDDHCVISRIVDGGENLVWTVVLPNHSMTDTLKHEVSVLSGPDEGVAYLFGVVQCDLYYCEIDVESGHIKDYFWLNTGE